MGNNKRRKQINKMTFIPVTKKAHVPTAMELAFLRAEAQKVKDSSCAAKKEVSQTSTPKKIEIITQAPAKVIVPQVNTPSLNSKAKAFSTPLSVPQIKKVPVIQNTSPTKLKPTRIATPPSKKLEPVKLGLKQIPDKALILDSVDPYEEKNKSKHGERQKETAPSSGKTQVQNGSHSDECDIVIGFDFGTSSSKVIIRDSGRQTAYAVPFNSLACSGNSYLIPTRLYINEDGRINLSAGDHSCGNIKSRLMDDPDQNIFSASNIAQSITVSEVAAGYMSIVIRLARDWFLKNTASIYKKTHIHWHINIGMPSRNYDNVKMRKHFQVMAVAAWNISVLESPITIPEIKEILRESRRYVDANDNRTLILPEDVKHLWIHPDYVNAHPEVIMEVVGYARSPLRTNGLHLIVDVGATTLDAATFIIHSNEGEDLFPILETAVERLGTVMLHLSRVDAVKAAMEKSLQKIAAIDHIRPLPDISHYAIGAHNAEIDDIHNIFFLKCSKMIGNAIRDTKNNRDPNSSVWDNMLPVFICGGGGRLSSYRTMIVELGSRFADAWGGQFKGFIIKEIPKPDQLEAPDLLPKEYDRLAVAYGLSFTSDEIGEVIAQSLISDIPQQIKMLNIEDKFVDKDMC